MDRILWKPSDELVENGVDFEDIDFEKHCGNCKLGITNNGFGCSHWPEIIVNDDSVLVISTCSGVVRKYSKKVGSRAIICMNRLDRRSREK